jgi:hypothetical protein
MPSEMKSLLTLLLPIVIILVVGTVETLKEYGGKYFLKNLYDTLLNGVDICLYVASLYYIYILFEHIEADGIMYIGLRLIICGCWLAWVLSKISSNHKKENQTQIISVIKKEKEYAEKEIHRIETQFDSVEQQLEEIAEERKVLSHSWFEYDFEIDRLKEAELTTENKAKIKRILILRKSISDEIERSNCEEERLKNELRKLSAELTGRKSALRSIKEIAKTIEGVDLIL